MKFIKRDGDQFVFQVGKREKRLLLEVLKLYPLVPATHHRLSKSADAKQVAENQKLLEEALAERKRENQRQLLALLNDEPRFRETDGGYQLTLGAPQMEWLFQVVNDIRVGSWLVLGEPDEKKGKPIELNPKNARYYAAMEFCGYLQMTLLEALEREA
ncbi:MAG TPA: DUF2017 family protein, partial [Haliangiales bacterium]|nr:DUF2017 family protein [Haliangiales bacterium]